MVYSQIYEIENNELKLILPLSFKNKTKVLVTIDDKVNSIDEKIELMKLAASDPLFLEDINEVMNDFKFSDAEI
jgi:hypothetical protein